MLLYSMVVLLEQHLEQRRRKVPHAQLRGIMRWISPPTAPACRGEIIPVKSSADHRPVTDAGRACVEQFQTAHFPFPIQILHWNSKHLERGAFVGATEWRQWIHRCRTAQGETEGQWAFTHLHLCSRRFEVDTCGIMPYHDEEYPGQPLWQSVVLFCCKGMIEGIMVILFFWLLVQVLFTKQLEGMVSNSVVMSQVGGEASLKCWYL